MVVLYPFHLYKRIRFEKKYTEFLYENNGMNFFCYNNRKNSKNYIEKSIIPNLTEQVEIVYLNGKKVESKQKSIFISEALFKLKKYNRFPHLMKIRNGKLIDKSINNPFYNVLNLNKDKTSLLTKINLFFELNEIENGA
ncbi:hypothetical protein BTR34_06105 [Maribacter hydrothermalis]|nr:hypothetical protein BTR34_06105 [Maribacter hydrothermalis]